MASLILFDDNLPTLSPLCDLRASFELRTGALCTFERLAEQASANVAAMFVPEEMREWVASRHSLPMNELPSGGEFLFLNGRWTNINIKPPAKMNSALVDPDGALVAALLDRHNAERFTSSLKLPPGVKTEPASDAKMLSRPWQVLQRAEENLVADLGVIGRRLNRPQAEPAPRVTIVGEHPIYIGKTSTVHPHVVFDTSAGPIVIDEGAVVRSMSVMVGPGYVGRDSVVCNHAHIRASTVIGPHCKVGGEVNACLFQGYANKAHSGYLGNSFVGEWVNLGADTVTSNLKNTYGEVRMRCDPRGGEEHTGMQFLGSIIGDHVKTAIGTRLMTGSCLHTGAMLAVSDFPPRCVAPFSFLTDAGTQLYGLDKFCEVAEAVMLRRGTHVTPALKHRLERLHRLAAGLTASA